MFRGWDGTLHKGSLFGRLFRKDFGMYQHWHFVLAHLHLYATLLAPCFAYGGLWSVVACDCVCTACMHPNTCLQLYYVLQAWCCVWSGFLEFSQFLSFPMAAAFVSLGHCWGLHVGVLSCVLKFVLTFQ